MSENFKTAAFTALAILALAAAAALAGCSCAATLGAEYPEVERWWK